MDGYRPTAQLGAGRGGIALPRQRYREREEVELRVAEWRADHARLAMIVETVGMLARLATPVGTAAPGGDPSVPDPPSRAERENARPEAAIKRRWAVSRRSRRSGSPTAVSAGGGLAAAHRTLADPWRLERGMSTGDAPETDALDFSGAGPPIPESGSAPRGFVAPEVTQARLRTAEEDVYALGCIVPPG